MPDILEEINRACSWWPYEVYGFQLTFRPYVPAAENPFLVALWTAGRKEGPFYCIFCGDGEVVQYEKGDKFDIPIDARLIAAHPVAEFVRCRDLGLQVMMEFLRDKYKK